MKLSRYSFSRPVAFNPTQRNSCNHFLYYTYRKTTLIPSGFPSNTQVLHRITQVPIALCTCAVSLSRFTPKCGSGNMFRPSHLFQRDTKNTYFTAYLEKHLCEFILPWLYFSPYFPVALLLFACFLTNVAFPVYCSSFIYFSFLFFSFFVYLSLLCSLFLHIQSSSRYLPFSCFSFFLQSSFSVFSLSKNFIFPPFFPSFSYNLFPSLSLFSTYL